MRIEVNNVYQKKSISKIKVGIVVSILVILVIAVFWRLYYERAQTTGVSSFAEFIGIKGLFDGEKKPLENCIDEALGVNDTENNLEIDNSNEMPSDNENSENPEIAKYIPNFTEQSFNNINKIYNLSEDGQKRVYLTFDDGPSRDVTPLVLDVLKEEQVHATFFVLGNKVEENPDVLKRIYEEGHYIANHGYSHVYSKIYANIDTVMEEYNSCETAIRQALEIPEYSTHLFRFPGGSSGGPYDYIKKICSNKFKENNIGILDWNCLTRDSEGNFPKEKLVENFKQTSTGKNNLVILMHDASGKILVSEVLKEIIACLKDEGYIFGNMRELVGE